jgi:hypothetical protein
MILLLLGGVLAPALAQDEGPMLTNEVVGGWRLTNLQALDPGVIDDSSASASATLSPNARYIFWTDDRNTLCLYELASTTNTCWSFPDDPVRADAAEAFVWSPDERYVAFSDTSLRLAYEGDLWVFDTQEGRLINLTDDGIIGSMLGPDDEEIWIDYLPTWSPDGALYFVRATRLEEGYGLNLYRFPRQTLAGVELWGELEIVMDLTPTLGTGLPFYDNRPVPLDGVLSFSPDGQWLALAVNDEIGRRNEDLPGIYLLNLPTGDLTQLVSRAAMLASNLPAWEDPDRPVFLQITGLAWASNSASLVATLFDPSGRTTPTSQSYQVEVATGQITPLFNWQASSEVGFESDLRSDGTTARFDVTFQLVLAQDVLVFRNDRPFGFSAIDLNAPRDLPVRLAQYADGEYDSTPWAFSSTGTDGQRWYVLLDGQLLTFERAE